MQSLWEQSEIVNFFILILLKFTPRSGFKNLLPFIDEDYDTVFVEWIEKFIYIFVQNA